jgi:Sulfotransferase family
MLISRKHNFLFVHIYKTAGTSITSALMPFAASRWQWMAHRALRKLNLPTYFPPSPEAYKHLPAPEIIKLMGREAFESYFSFAIVRNPWDWQVSLYKFVLKDPSNQHHSLVKALGGFDAYIKWRCEKEARFQKDFIYSSDNELLVDFVGHFEQLDADFQSICSRIGISASLPKLNVSNERPYQQYYTDETRELVRRTFAPDITLFGYDF